jgi:hypothetical protein
MAVSKKPRKATKAARARTAKKPARSQAIAPDTGPVTLAEAKALARARQP